MTARAGMLAALTLAGIAWAAHWVWRPDACGGENAVPCPSVELERGVGRTIPEAQACEDSAYLCLPLESEPSFQIRRWPLSRGRIRIRVPAPPGIDGALGDSVRLAAAVGILKWDGHPFPLEVDLLPVPLRRWDAEVVWTEGLTGGHAGQTTIRTRIEGDRIRYRVLGVAVVSRLADGSVPSLSEVASVAAHEMGHALGLRHSDQRDDIMFPSAKPGPSLSPRDVAAVGRLYELPNGADVVR